MTSAKHTRWGSNLRAPPRRLPLARGRRGRRRRPRAQLQRQLAEKTKAAQENLDRALRLAAEMENLKKRLEREKAELLQFANENLIKELLPVVDNLELALEHGRERKPQPLSWKVSNWCTRAS